MAEHEVAVIGLSVAGVAAALELASLRRRVTLLEHTWDTVLLVESVLVGPTPLAGEVATGPAFEEVARRACAELGVVYQPGRLVVAVDEAPDGTFLLASTEAVQQAETVVFAPNGAVTLPDGRFEPLLGRGVSLSAWDDAVLYRGQPVAVVGGGIRALEAAYVASRWASRVVVICPTPTLEAGGLLAKVSAERDNVDLLYGAEVAELATNARGEAVAAHVRVGERMREVPVRGVIVAGDPIVDWSLWPTDTAARVLAARDRLFLTGLAAGIDPFDHTAQYRDGKRAAWACSSASETLSR